MKRFGVYEPRDATTRIAGPDKTLAVLHDGKDEVVGEPILGGVGSNMFFIESGDPASR